MNEMKNADPECLPDDGSTELLTGPCERNFSQIFQEIFGVLKLSKLKKNNWEKINSGAWSEYISMNSPSNPNFNDNESVSEIIGMLKLSPPIFAAAKVCEEVDVTAVKARCR